MVAYLNGEVFMSGTAKTRLMSGISSFRIGGTASSGFNGVYDGKIERVGGQVNTGNTGRQVFASILAKKNFHLKQKIFN